MPNFAPHGILIAWDGELLLKGREGSLSHGFYRCALRIEIYCNNLFSRIFSPSTQNRIFDPVPPLGDLRGEGAIAPHPVSLDTASPMLNRIEVNGNHDDANYS